MKFGNVTQWVPLTKVGVVPPDQSLANRSEVNSKGKPGNGSPKLEGTRLQAVLLSSEILLFVVSG